MNQSTYLPHFDEQNCNSENNGSREDVPQEISDARPTGENNRAIEESASKKM